MIYFMRSHIPAVFLLKANNRNTRTRCEICSKLAINTPERRQWRRCGILIVNFDNISHHVLLFLSLTLKSYAGWYIGWMRKNIKSNIHFICFDHPFYQDS